MSTQIIILRHGRTQWNQESRWQGQSDIPLDEVGHAQAAAAAAALSQLPIAKIVSSGLDRALETARKVGEQINLSVEIDHRLAETNGGLWEGLTQSEIRNQYQSSISEWFNNAQAKAGLTGESRIDVAARFHQAIDAHAVPNKTVLVVTHGGAARAGLMSLLGLPMDNAGVFKVLYNCGWAVLDLVDSVESNGIWRISDYNLTAAPPLPEQHI